MSIFSKIGDLFKKLLDAIKRIIAIVLIIVAVILIIWATIVTGGAALVVFGFAISTTMAYVIAALCIIGAFLIDKETASEIVGKIGEAAGDAAEAVAGVASEIISSGASGLVEGLFGVSGSSLLLYGALAVGAYVILSSSSNSTPTLGDDKTSKDGDLPNASNRKPVSGNDSTLRLGNSDDYIGGMYA